MSDARSLLERESRRFAQPDGAFERLVQRRDRKRRNQRIAAGVVGIAVFVAAIWSVTSAGWFDRTGTPAVPGAVTGPAETGPAETAPQPAGTSTAPDVVRQRTCSDGARSRLELTDMGDQIKVRFEVYQSPVGHEWRIHFRFVERNIPFRYGRVFFRGTRVASDSGVFVVQLLVRDWGEVDGLVGRAVDWQTDQVCKAFSWGA
jgi:hypothetical protein